MSDQNAVHMAHGRTDEQKEVMRQIEKDGVDPFDWNLLANYHREPILKQGEHWLITPNDYPYEGTELHLLLIYRERVRNLGEVKRGAFAELQEMLVWIESEFKLSHGTLVMRFDDIALTGGSVDHLHAHVIVGGMDTTTEKLKIPVGYKKK